ncbi:MAG: S8/S53 family peptidase [Clostridia bacterium]|nr:S8/S53 family peptidase [Clostridia bacterium]
MKLRNFANKLLLITILVLALFSHFTVSIAPTSLHLITAETVGDTPIALTKTYTFDQFNWNHPSDTEETLYEALGIKTYNNYLMALSATQALNEVVIAVVDSGLDATYPVFADRVLTDYAMDFSHGLPSTTNAWNVDENGHGTHVAGIIADITLSNVKILPLRIFYGANNSSSDYAFINAMRYLCALKRGEKVSLLNNAGVESETYNVYFNEEAKQIPNIVAVNMSLGSNGFNPYSEEDMTKFNTQKYGYTKNNVRYTGYQNVIDNLLKNEILPIVAAGNRTEMQYIRDSNGELIPYYSLPGGCDGVLAVSAYDNSEESYQLASFSYYNENVSIAAPGMNIWSACSRNVAAKMTKWYVRNQKDGYTYYERDNWHVMQDAEGNYYYRSNGTSMATPFVTACYAMLLSDSSKHTAADYGVTYDINNADDAKFRNVVHKALLAAAATNGAGADAFDIKFGYGTLNVSGFVLEAGDTTIAQLNSIEYEPFVNTSYPSASWGSVETSVYREFDWFMVCIILAVAVVAIWLVKMFKDYVLRRAKTNDDEQQ